MPLGESFKETVPHAYQEWMGYSEEEREDILQEYRKGYAVGEKAKENLRKRNAR